LHWHDNINVSGFSVVKTIGFHPGSAKIRVFILRNRAQRFFQATIGQKELQP